MVLTHALDDHVDGHGEVDEFYGFMEGGCDGRDGGEVYVGR